MTTPERSTTPADALRGELRLARQRYDRLDPGGKASLRRCRTAGEVALERAYWQVAGSLAEQYHLPHVVLLYPLATHQSSARFSFGRYLAAQLGDGDGAALRVRRLLAARDRDELDHRLRGLLRLADGAHHPVDWGSLGLDVLWFLADSDAVRRRWAQDFYAPNSAAHSSFTNPTLSRSKE